MTGGGCGLSPKGNTGRLIFEVVGLVLDLRSQAFAVIHVIARAEIHGLIQHPALFESVEVTDLTDLTWLRDFVISGDGDVATRFPAVLTQQLQRYAALPVNPRHYS